MNDEFTKDLLDSLGSDVGEKLSAKNVVTREQAVSALGSLSPVILSSLKRKQQDLDSDSFEALLSKASASESALDDLDDVLDPATPNAGIDEILDPEAQDQTVMALSKKLGLGGGAVKKLLPMLIPVILGQLMKKGKQQGGAGASRSSGIGGILDRNGDGTMIDDIAGMVLGGQSGGKGGILKMILSMIFGKK